MSRHYSDETIFLGIMFLLLSFVIVFGAIATGVSTVVRTMEKPKQRLTCKKGTEQIVSVDVAEVTLLNRKKFMQEMYSQYRMPGANDITQVTGQCTIQPLQ